MRKSTAVERLTTLAQTLAPEIAPARDVDGLLAQLDRAVPTPKADEVWLAIAVVTGDLPVRADVVDAVRAVRLDGLASYLRGRLGDGRRPAFLRDIIPPRVVVVTGATIVDVHHTARTGLATGIQRVVRKTIAEWTKSHTITLVGWDSSLTTIRELSPDLRTNALYGTIPDAHADTNAAVVVPWRSRYVLPELAVEDDRTSRIAALAEFSGNESVTIGYDCVPLTTAETSHVGISAAFSRTLVAVSHMRRVGTISVAAATEYRGWRSMLESVGKVGPEIEPVLLPAEAGEVDQEALDEAAATLVTDDLPLVVCVGSHEPRKNHLAVLQAAELLWCDGVEFSLVFVGGNAWSSEEFQGKLAQLVDEGRPVSSHSAITDDLLWSAYRLARCTIFPSLNEGYGLPVAESLAVGTPVITSAFGSMQEIASQGGALLVDPRDDDAIADALRTLIGDDEVDERLRAEASRRSNSSWAEYADQLWSFLLPEPVES